MAKRKKKSLKKHLRKKRKKEANRNVNYSSIIRLSSLSSMDTNDNVGGCR